MQATIHTPLLQLHGQFDGCIAPTPEDLDRRRFAAREHHVIQDVGHFLLQEAPRGLAARVMAWLA
jgi:pimeloyl-ACP methyl ester carboxylesterase